MQHSTRGRGAKSARLSSWMQVPVLWQRWLVRLPGFLWSRLRTEDPVLSKFKKLVDEVGLGYVCLSLSQ